ncbi:MAG: hypothetical protein MI922_11495, partial [Bacteroidales bacterium]|nr:hypothetical protein [Bacteroidales bacterium]
MKGIYVKDDFVYLISYDEHALVIMNASDKSNPVEVSNLSTSNMGTLSSVFVEGDYAYIASMLEDKLVIIDISDKSNPVEVGALYSASLDRIVDVYVVGDYAYTINDVPDTAFAIVNVSNRSDPELVSSFVHTDSSARSSVFVEDDLAYITSGDISRDTDLLVLNVTNKSNPVEVGSIENSSLSSGRAVFVKDGYAYIAIDASGGPLSVARMDFKLKDIYFNLSQGAHDLIVYGGDEYGNVADSGLIDFNIDLVRPNIVVDSPISKEYNYSAIDFNITSDKVLGFCKFTFDGWDTEFVMDIDSMRANYSFESMSDGNYSVEFLCDDGYGNVNNTEKLNFSVMVDPVVYIHSPVNGSTYGGSVDLNWGVSEELDWCGYSLNGGANNTDIFYRALSRVGYFNNDTSLHGVNSVALEDGYLYVGSPGDTSFTVIDVKDSKAIGQVGYFKDDYYFNSINSLDVDGDYAYTVGYPWGSALFTIIDISDRANPSFGSGPSLSFNPASIHARDNYTYIGGEDSLTIIKILATNSYSNRGTFSNSTSLSGVVSVYVDGDYAYVVGNNTNSLVIVNVSNDNSPVQVGYLGLADVGSVGPNSVYVDGDYAYVVAAGNSSLSVVNVTDKASPSLVGRYSNVSYLFGARSVFVEDDWAYVVSNSTGISVLRINVSDKTRGVLDFVN